ncbi:MAG: hypothetical protein ACTSU5_20535 [Promethearchaeota archaeon]
MSRKNRNRKGGKVGTFSPFLTGEFEDFDAPLVEFDALEHKLRHEQRLRQKLSEKVKVDKAKTVTTKRPRNSRSRRAPRGWEVEFGEI